MCFVRNLLRPQMQFKCEIWGLKLSQFRISFLPATDMIPNSLVTSHTFIHEMMASKEAMDKN